LSSITNPYNPLERKYQLIRKALELLTKHKFPVSIVIKSALADKDVVKESGLKIIKEVLIKTIKAKPNKVLFGTDYACCSIKKHIKLISSLDISKEMKEKIFLKMLRDCLD